MGTIDEIRAMRGQGMSEGEVRENLRRRGLSSQEIEESINQSNIKEAVSQGSGEQQNYPPQQNYSEPPPQQYSSPRGFEGMQPSMIDQQNYPQNLAAQGLEQVGREPAEGGVQSFDSYASPDYSTQPEYAGQYGGEYQPYQEGVSSDVITEISEQVVDERLEYLKGNIEKSLSFAAVAEAKINSLDERLKRIEKIIDNLQVSILQKVGEYVGDVKDIKKELIETQKSFKAIEKGKHHARSSSGHSHSHEHSTHHKK